MAADKAECVCCHQALDAVVEPIQALACGHAFHNECITAYISSTGLALDDVKCPTCKLNSADVTQLAMSHGAPPLPENDETATVHVPDADDDCTPNATSAASTHPQPTPTPDGNITALPMEHGSQTYTTNAAYRGDERPLEMLMDVIPIAGDSDAVVCDDCGLGATLERCRVKSKGAGSFRCYACSTVFSKIYNASGSGIGKKVLELPEGDRHDFMRVAQSSTTSEIKGKILMVLEKSESREETYERGGAFLPLSVWAGKGWDIEIIKNDSLPRNIVTDRMFGQMYRVPVITITETNRKRNESTTKLTVDATDITKGAKRIKAVVGKVDESDSVVASDKASSDTDISDSSDDSDDIVDPVARKAKVSAKKLKRSEGKKLRKDKRKAAKVSKKEKQRTKDDAKMARDSAKALAKQATDAARAVQRDAESASKDERKAKLQLKQFVGQVMKKLDVAMVQLEKTLRTPGVNLLAEGSTKDLLEIKQEWTDMYAACGLVSSGMHTPVGFVLPSLDDVKKKLDRGKKLEACLHLNVKAALKKNS